MLPDRPATAPVVLREPDAARYCSVSLSTMRRGRREGWGPKWVRLTERALGYRVSDLDAWLTARTAQTAHPHVVAR